MLFFLISDIGMKFLVGDDWKDYFDVVIVQARKPKFFTEESRPLRIYDEINKTQLWDRVTKLEKGVIYLEVCIKRFAFFFLISRIDIRFKIRAQLNNYKI